MDNFKTKILVVDDEPLSALVLKELLEKIGYEVIIAENGMQAWDKLTESNYNIALVIADRMMPGIDGVELTRMIRNNMAFKNVPVIMLTGDADRDEQKAALESGIFDFLLKPIEPELLYKVTERALRDGRGF